jgi:hypothetical protein
VKLLQSRRKLARAPGPAARLHAGDRDSQFAAGRRKDRQVQHAVLLGAYQLLAVDQQHVVLGAVAEQQFGDRAGFRDLGHVRQRVLQGLVEQHVGRGDFRRRQQRHHSQVGVRDRCAERKRAKRLLQRIHRFSSSV